MATRHRPRRHALALALMLGLLARGAEARAADGLAEVTGVEVRAQGEAATVSIATSRAPRYRSELMDGPYRLVLDFEDAAYRWKTAPVSVGVGPVREIRGSQYRKGVVRVVIELTRKVAYALEPHAAGVRIVFAPAGAAVPDAPPGVPAPAVAPSATAPPASHRLQGIVLRDDEPVAYIADPATNRVGRYQVGDTIGDAVVETIEERHVVLRTPRGAVELRLEELRPGPRSR